MLVSVVGVTVAAILSLQPYLTWTWTGWFPSRPSPGGVGDRARAEGGGILSATADRRARICWPGA